MGAWSHTGFGNDDASDWWPDLLEDDDLTGVDRALRRAPWDYLYLQAPKGSVMVAAAEVVAAGLGAPAADMPSELASWIRRIPRERYVAMRARALAALGGVTSRRSELAQLWAGGDVALNPWTEYIGELRARLERQ